MINVVYMATPQIAVNCLQKLNELSDINIQAVVTQPDRPCGRGNKITPPPVKEYAVSNNLQVFQTESIKKDEELKEKLKELNPDFFVTFAFGQILTQDVLDIPKIATVNLHASLLPKYRGANPIQRAIYEGENKTGITTMITVLALDAGDICLQEEIQITSDMTDRELSQIISEKSPALMYETLKGLYNKTLVPMKQDDSLMTIAKKFKKEDSFLDWNKTAQTLHNQVRSMTVWPSAHTMFNGKSVKILKTSVLDDDIQNCPAGEVVRVTKEGIAVKTGKNLLLIKELKPEGKGQMSAYAWSNGAGIKTGNKFEQIQIQE